MLEMVIVLQNVRMLRVCCTCIQCQVSLVLLRLFMGGMNVFKKSSFFNSNSTSLHKVDTFFPHKNSRRVGRGICQDAQRDGCSYYIPIPNQDFLSLTQKRTVKSTVQLRTVVRTQGLISRLFKIDPQFRLSATKFQKTFFCRFVNIFIFLRENIEVSFFIFLIFKLKQP